MNKKVQAQQLQQDCFSAINVCTASYSQNSINSGFGSVLDVAPLTTCLDSGEANSSWFIFRVISGGSFNFQIAPNTSSDDYDFALYNLSGDSCASIANGGLQPLRCNYSSTPGSTGLQNGATGTQEPTAGPNQCSPLTVTTGQIYALMVNNFTGSTNGYVLNLGGTASVFDNVSPQVDTITHGTACNPKTIYLYFTEPILCSSISSDLSEITITGPAAPTITSFTAVGCNSNGMTNRINITFASAISAIGNYVVHFGNGSDGDTFIDGCNNYLNPSYTYTFPVDHIGPTVTLVSVTNSNCTSNTGAVDVSVSGGQPPYTYSWNSNPVQTTQDLSGVGNGTYSLVVTDAIGCTAFYSKTITDLNSPTLTLVQNSPITCYGQNNGSASVLASGGTPPYIYTWNTTPVLTGSSVNSLGPGAHSVTVTDSQGCSRSLNVTTIQPGPLNIQISKNNTTCGNSIGSINATVSGGIQPYSYSWNTSPVQTVPNLTNLPVGIYTLTVRDSNNCVSASTVTIASTTAQLGSIQSATPSCDEPSGTATAIATGPNPPYTFLWNTQPPQNTAAASNLSAGTYYVVITGSDNCSQILNVKVDTLMDVIGNLIVSNDASCGEADGSATVDGLLGLSPYSFQWQTNPVQTSATATGLSAGTYPVIITDANGCDDTLQVVVSELVGTADFTWSQTCFGYITDFYAVTNLDSAFFVWSFGDTTNLLTNADTGQQVTHYFPSQDSFYVTLISSGGCLQDTLTKAYAVNPLPEPSFTTGNSTLYTENNLQFQYTGTPAQTYYWDFGNNTTSTSSTPNTTYLDSGTHVVTLAVIDANGCTDTIQTTIFVAKKPNIYMPNAFVPVNQSKNPIYKVYGYDVDEIDFRIYSRWGNVVFATQDPQQAMDNGWDGTYLGKPLPQGVYGYKIWVKFADQREFEKTGTITLVR
ncbi:MAG: gliding motility-associated C-terminal domain-containing protein [Bacteroidia bacterium]|nr:gliding motility-associated C-terminal domain-containing protein [Bacteroidia bacterium]